jgi:Zn finger protein HypA/HybF involved in hydrogenase expression
VVAITLRIGRAAGVDADALALAFACAMDGTPAATAKLTIEPVAGRDLVLAALELG